MKTVCIFSPYWMGNFSPGHLAMARHTWRILAAPPPEGPPMERMGFLCRALANEVADVRAGGNLPLVIAGDCTFSIGVAAALQRETPDFTLAWFDAHGDFNTPQTTPSGFIGGMPLAMLCGRGEQTIVTRAGAQVHPESGVILTDARDLDPGEKEAVAASGIHHLPNVADLLSLPLPNRPIYIHFDCDVLRVSDLPAVSYPAKGGPAVETVEAALAHLAETGRVAAVSVTMWNPELDDEEGQSGQVVMGIVERLVDRLQSAGL